MQERIQNERESLHRRRRPSADDATFETRPPAGDLRRARLLAMQRTVGNRAVRRQMGRVQRLSLGDLGGGGVGSVLDELLGQLTNALGGLFGGGGIGGALSGLMGQATGALGGLLGGGGGGGGIGGALSGLMGQATGALGGLASRARDWLGGLF